MRSKFLLQPIFWAMVVMLTSCQKGVEKQSDNSQLISKINNWLDKQKSPTQPNKAANIDLLKESVDFSALRFESLNVDETFIIIPISDNYRIKKNIDKNTVPVLLLVMNNAETIIRGNLVMYIPGDNHPMNRIPGNTFSKMYSEKNLDCSGLFRFLSPTGTWLYQREYRNGKLHSFGYVKADNSYAARTSTECTHYVLNLYLWYDGVLIAQETIYIGSYCPAGCDDPNNQTLCPDDVNGGGGGAGEGQETCCIPDPNAQITFEHSGDSDWDCLPETIDQTTGRPTKSCTYTWTFHRNHLLWYNWDFVAITNAKFEKIGEIWKFIETTTPAVSPSFQGVTTEGQLPPCVSSKCISVAPTLVVAGNKAWAALGLSYTVETKVLCFSWATPRYDPATVQATLNPPT